MGAIHFWRVVPARVNPIKLFYGLGQPGCRLNLTNWVSKPAVLVAELSAFFPKVVAPVPSPVDGGNCGTECRCI